MYELEVVTTWTVDSDGANVPAVAALLGPGDSCEDRTGQPAQNITPDPNVVVFGVFCSADTLSAIEADAGHTVLWSAEVVTDGAE
jgi:hypothetical protein